MTLTRTELEEAARKAFEGTLAEDRWSMIADMGLLMAAVPEARGGLGLGGEAVGTIHVELGRALVSGPAIAQMMAIEALAGSDAPAELLDRAMSGDVMTASLAADGTLTCVPDADRASHVLVVSPGRVALAPLDGATITPRETWDRTRRLFDVAPSDDGIVLAEGSAADALAERIEQLMLLALAGDSLGGAEAILGLTIDYLKTRRQFDRPLALFQALKHRVADMKTQLAAADALFRARAAGQASLVEIGALKAHATTVYRAIAEEAVQLHGGIGLTMEHHCHLFLKRATLNAALGGDADRREAAAGREKLARAFA
jgi:alkylation response protein AidB-like acyl-CoA dehydrogenase